MTAAARKKPVVVEAAPADDGPRAALAAAITAHAESSEAVEAKQQTIRRAYEAITAAETRIERCGAAMPKAQESDAKDAASRLDKGGTPVAPWHTQKATIAVEHAEQALRVATAAHRRLKQDLSELEDNLAEAANNVLVEVKLLTLPIVERLLAETTDLKRRLHMNQRLMDLLMFREHANDQPRFHNDMRGMRAAKRRDEVFAALRTEAEHLAFGLPEDVLPQLAVWKAALVSLRSDPKTELPEVK
jgi:hypothetical protein